MEPKIGLFWLRIHFNFCRGSHHENHRLWGDFTSWLLFEGIVECDGYVGCIMCYYLIFHGYAVSILLFDAKCNFFSNIIILCQNKCAMFDKALHKRLKVNKKCVLYGRKTRFWKKNSHSVRPYFKTKSLTFRRLLNCTFFRKFSLMCFQCAST